MLALAIIILLAFLLDLILGDPRYRLHPIRLMGRCIGLLTRILKRVGLGGKKGGILLTAMMEFLFFAAFLTVHFCFMKYTCSFDWHLTCLSAIPALP